MEAIFVGTLDGVFKVTRTSGTWWQLAVNDLKRLEVNELAVRPDKRELIYAGNRGAHDCQSQAR
jgi:hypothetical protein